MNQEGLANLKTALGDIGRVSQSSQLALKRREHIRFVDIETSNGAASVLESLSDADMYMRPGDTREATVFDPKPVLELIGVSVDLAQSGVSVMTFEDRRHKQ